jgi:hypothetical protein
MVSLDDVFRFLKKKDTKAAAELRQVRKALENLAGTLKEQEESKPNLGKLEAPPEVKRQIEKRLFEELGIDFDGEKGEEEN